MATLIVKTCSPKACFKLFRQVVTSLQVTVVVFVTSLNLPGWLQRDEIDKFVATSWQVAANR